MDVIRHHNRRDQLKAFVFTLQSAKPVKYHGAGTVGIEQRAAFQDARCDEVNSMRLGKSMLSQTLLTSCWSWHDESGGVES